jgi:hypothetical protein
MALLSDLDGFNRPMAKAAHATRAISISNRPMAKAAHATRVISIRTLWPGVTLNRLDAALSASSIPGVFTALAFPSSSRVDNDEGADEGAGEGETDGDREVVVVSALVPVDPPVIVGGAVLIIMSRKAL